MSAEFQKAGSSKFACFIARLIRAMVRLAREGCRAHSQILTMRQPASRRLWFTAWSRLMFRLSFAFQKAILLFGIRRWRGHPCQKHPSTNTAIRSRAKTKSGQPDSRTPRRHPRILAARSNAIIRNSVLLLPARRTRDMRSERWAGVSVSI